MHGSFADTANCTAGNLGNQRRFDLTFNSDGGGELVCKTNGTATVTKPLGDCRDTVLDFNLFK